MQFNLAGSIPREKARAYFEKLMARDHGTIEIRQVRAKRSNPQNAYLHMVLADMGQHLGYTLEEIKTLAKRNCGLAYQHPNGGMFLRSTADLDTKEFCEFVERLQRWASESFDYYVPDPNEYVGDDKGERHD